MKPYIVGVDLGGTTVKIGLFEKEQLLEKWEIPTRTEENGKYILEDIAKSIREELNKRRIYNEQVQGVGMCVPGAVTEDGMVNKCVNLGWDRVNADDILSEYLGGIKVKVANDANVAALGEMWKGGGKGFKNVVMVTLGTGVGGGVIIDGKIHNGSFGACGEIGHMLVNPNETAVCGCGKKGHLEQYASANGVARMARIHLNESNEDSCLRKVKTVSSKDVFDGAKAGDKLCHEIVEEFGQTLGRALAVTACLLDPEIFVIGGGMSKAGQIVIDVVHKYYVEAAFHATADTKFALASLGNDAGIYGCVKMILDNANEHARESADA